MTLKEKLAKAEELLTEVANEEAKVSCKEENPLAVAKSLRNIRCQLEFIEHSRHPW